MSNASDTSVLRGRTPFTHHVTPITGSYTLSMSEAMEFVLEFTGTINSDFNVLLPPVDGHSWLIKNSCSGSGVMTAKTSAAGSVGLAIAQGAAVPCWCDALNILPWAASSISGTLTAQEIADLGALPSNASGAGPTSTGGIFDEAVSTSSTIHMSVSVGLCDTIHFHDANQDFTAILPVLGPFDEWLCWNDTDYVATLLVGSTVTSTAAYQNANDDTNGVTIPPRSRAVAGIVVQTPASHDPSYGIYTIRLYGTTGPYTGAATVTVPNASTYTLTIAQAANPFIKLTGGNQPATLTFPAGEAVVGREWTLWNNTSFLLGLKGNPGDGFGLDLPSGCFAHVALDDTLRLYCVTPIVVHNQHSFVRPAGSVGLSLASDTPSFTWGIIQNFDLEVGGTRSNPITATWETGTGITAGQTWIVTNGTNQVLVCIASGGTNAITLQVGDRRFIRFDGADLHLVPDGYLQGHSGNGTNRDGGDLVIASGQATGFGTPGAIRFKQSQPGSTGTALTATYDKLVLVDTQGSLLQLHAGTSEVFRIQTVEAATSGAALKSLPGIDFQGQYWNGSVSTAVHAVTDLNVSAAAKFQYRISTAGSPRLKIGEAGQVIYAGTTLAADSDLANSELSIALDNTPGATKVLFKAKDSGGTVRTGNVALS